MFVATKEGADRLTKFLERGGHNVTSIHGDRSQSQRNKALQHFKHAVPRDFTKESFMPSRNLRRCTALRIIHAKTVKVIAVLEGIFSWRQIPLRL